MPDYGRDARPHFHHGLSLEQHQWLLSDVHEAIQAHPAENHGVNSMPAIKFQGIVYCTFRSLTTGIRSYMPARPVFFGDDTNRLGPGYSWRKNQI